MKRIRLYRNPTCKKCERIAHVHRLFDWLNRLEDSTEESPLGPLKPFEIAVQDLATAITYKGADAVKLIFKNIPAYWPCLVLFHFSFFRNIVERQVRGCDDSSCTISTPHKP
ncbi:MAG: hypothetical protein ABL921_22570 [Pirellula sp.]